jgi:hypothetical protein
MSTSTNPVPAPLAALVARWRANAAVLRSYGAPGHARLLERLAADLEAELHAESAAVVNLADAVHLSGYTRGHLRRLLRTRQLRNLGSDIAPEFAASDLPRKPGYVPAHETLAPPPRSGVNSRLQVARAVVSGN